MATEKQIQDAIRASFANSSYKVAPNFVMGTGAGVAKAMAAPVKTSGNVDQAKSKKQNAILSAKIAAITGEPAKDHSNGPSILSRIGDVISRPLYAVNTAGNEAIKSIKEGDNVFEMLGESGKGLGSGLAGTQKTHFSDILHTTGADEWLLDQGTAGKAGLIAASIIGDIALDPLTYVTFGTKAVSTANDAAKAVGATNRTGRIANALGTLADAAGSNKAVGRTILANAEENALKIAKDLPDASKLVQSLPENAHTVERAVQTVEDATTMAARTLDAAMGSKSARLVAKDRVAPQIANLRASGQTVGRKLENQMIRDEMVKVAEEIAQKTQEAGNLKKVITVGTKNHQVAIPFSGIIPAASAEMKKAFMATQLGGDFANKFSTGHLFGSMNLIKRREESMGVARSEELIKVAREQFGKLSAEDSAKLVEHYMSRNVGSLSPELQNAADLLKGHLDDNYLAEIKSGIRQATPEQVNIIMQAGTDPQAIAAADNALRASLVNDPNYVEGFIPQYYKGNPDAVKAAQKAKSDALKAGKTPWQAEQAARDLGVKPITKVDDIISNYIARVMRPQIRKEIKADAIRQYGIQFENIKDPAEIAKYADQMGLVKITDPKFYLGTPPDTYLPKSIMTSINHIEEFYKDPAKAEELLKFYDKVLSQFKTSATLLNPASWVRNFMGDSFQAYVAGVRDPTLYKDALSILKVEPGTGATIRIAGNSYSKEKLLQLFEQSGAKSGFIRSEHGSAKALEKIRGMAETREDVPRLATWLHTFRQQADKELAPLHSRLSELEKLNKAQNFTNPNTYKELQQLRSKIMSVEEQVSHKAAANVSKWMVDYGDFTKFEMSTMRRVIPFYSFMRKNIPLQIEGLAMRPGTYNNAMNVGRNIDTYMADPNDPGIYPKWLRDMGFARLGSSASGGQNVWSPQMPWTDLEKTFGGGTQGIIGNQLASLTPAATIPIELGMGKDIFSGKDISNQGSYPYFTGQIPLYAVGKNWVKGIGDVASGKGLDATQLNQLFGIGTRDVTEGQQNSELKRQQFELVGELRKLKSNQ